jgi:cysteine-rich repeat protein
MVGSMKRRKNGCRSAWTIWDTLTRGPPGAARLPDTVGDMHHIQRILSLLTTSLLAAGAAVAGTPPVPQVCGDGAVQGGEGCDDGNRAPATGVTPRVPSRMASCATTAAP